jgi:hypothetical protein
MRPELWSTLAELVGSIQPTGEAAEMLRVDRVELDVPMEITFRVRGGEPTLLGSPPMWRWPTSFDRKPDRLHVVLKAEVVPELPIGGEAA